MDREITVKKSVAMAMRRPSKSHALLAKTLATLINGENWINWTLKKKFCMLFMNNLIDRSIEREVDSSLLEKIKSMPLASGIRFLKRTPDEGLKVLVVLIAEELNDQQEFSPSEQVAFLSEIYDGLFPECKHPPRKEEVIRYEVIRKKPRHKGRRKR